MIKIWPNLIIISVNKGRVINVFDRKFANSALEYNMYYLKGNLKSIKKQHKNAVLDATETCMISCKVYKYKHYMLLFEPEYLT